MSFADRVAQHDGIGIPAVRSDWERYGCRSVRAGNEMDDPDVRSFLAGQNDRLALMLRYRPDTIIGKPAVKTFLVEIKTNQAGQKNWAIEFDAWRGLVYWNQHWPNAIVAFVHSDGAIGGYCLADKIHPNEVTVPRRIGYQEWLDVVSKQCPGVKFRQVEYLRRGSGTPFFLVMGDSVGVGKMAPPLDEFIASLGLENWTATATRVLTASQPATVSGSVGSLFQNNSGGAVDAR